MPLALNVRLFTETFGQVKILSIIFGAISFFLTLDNYNTSITEEEVFFWSVLVCLIISIVLAVLSLLGILENINAAKIDKAFHGLAAILLIIISCFFIVSVDNQKGGSNYKIRATAGAFGLFYGFVCSYIGGFI